jgi:hypothetical protein
MMNKAQGTTRNIAKSGEVLNWSGFSPFQLHLSLIVNRSQFASCNIANRCQQCNDLIEPIT